LSIWIYDIQITLEENGASDSVYIVTVTALLHFLSCFKYNLHNSETKWS